MTMSDDWNLNVLVLNQLCTTKTVPKITVFICDPINDSMIELANSYMEKAGYTCRSQYSLAPNAFQDGSANIICGRNIIIDKTSIPNTSKVVLLTDDYSDINRNMYMTFSFYDESEFGFDGKCMYFLDMLNKCNIEELCRMSSILGDIELIRPELIRVCTSHIMESVLYDKEYDIPFDRYLKELSVMPVNNFVGLEIRNGRS